MTATIDGVAIPNAALGAKRPADPGKHVLQVGAPGFETTEVDVTLAEGKTETVTMTLKPGEGVRPEGPGPRRPLAHQRPEPRGLALRPQPTLALRRVRRCVPLGSCRSAWVPRGSCSEALRAGSRLRSTATSVASARTASAR